MTTITIDRATVEQALEALNVYASKAEHRRTHADDCAAEEAITALRAALAQPVPHGCHVYLEHGMEPDECVLDEGSPNKCIYARRLLREGKDKTACEYWKPIEVKR